MKELTKKILKIALITSIVSIVATIAYFGGMVNTLTDASSNSFKQAEEIMDSKESEESGLGDVEGYAVMINGIAGGLGVFGAVIIIFVIVVIVIGYIITLLLFWIASFIHRKKDSKARNIISMILIILAILARSRSTIGYINSYISEIIKNPENLLNVLLILILSDGICCILCVKELIVNGKCITDFNVNTEITE